MEVLWIIVHMCRKVGLVLLLTPVIRSPHYDTLAGQKGGQISRDNKVLNLPPACFFTAILEPPFKSSLKQGHSQNAGHKGGTFA